MIKDQDEKCLKDSEENKRFLHPSPTSKDTELVYGVSDIPPWYYTLFLGAQSYLLMVGSTLGVPFYLCPMMCMDDNDPSRIKITSSIIFVSGIVTILQSSLGVRLPIIQGGTFGFLLPTMAILSSSFPSCDTYNFSNMTLIEKEEVWKILLATVFSWLFCFLLTMFEVLPKGSPARTDTELSLIYDSPWFYIPYPFQWGIPTVSASGVIGMLSGVLASVAESIGDYYACARLSGTGPPPTHAVNRGVTVEGIGCLIAGVMGTGNVAGVFMIAFSMVGKLGGLFVSIPNPVIGGASLIHFGIIVYIGLSNLHLVDLNSSRNLFILGVSLFNGLAIPQYIGRHPGIIQTRLPFLDQTLTVLLSTSIFVGGFLGLVLDNTIPGNK
ncbi:Solute carrier family 23 member 2 [Armadillidium nasatum]|uniref:Solute carrier family 23 member 2 n=1 Tax=Armadillidium nasatum TaxID=96803 RepID=A0A5N5TNE8_9CRUS|nr:Solute carrier family 23 member 2 [Armadillidium nasatum]